MKILIVLIIVLLLLPKGSDKGTKKGKSSRPWYDISYNDMENICVTPSEMMRCSR